MNPPRFFISILAVSIIATGAAMAQATRTWVSGVGDDANPCSRTAPCKTFAGAISKTITGGEIDNLDAGGFGALTITKSITIDGGGGGIASVLVSGTPGITIAAGTGAVVTLRNLNLQGINQSGSGGTNGIVLLSAAALHIEHCAIMGFSGDGIDVTPSSQPANGTQVFIEDTVSQDNGGNGLTVLASGTDVHVSVVNSRFTNNSNGVVAEDYSRVSAHNSDSHGNANEGFLANAATGTTVISLSDTAAYDNGGSGLQAGGAAPSAIRIEHVSLYSNAEGITIGANGTVASFGNNYNTNPGAPNQTLTPQ